jgi:O-antigen/teichoic acid export membrane protein
MVEPDNKLVARFVRRSASFGTVLLAVKVLNFLFLFLYWRLLDPAHFGIIAVVQGVSMVLAPGLNLGLSNAVSRLYKEHAARGQGPDLVGNAFLCTVAGSLIFCFAATLLGAALFRLALPSVPFSPYLQISIWSAFFLSICLFGDQVVRVKDRLRLNALFIILEFLLKNSLILSAILFLTADPAFAYLMGEMIALGLLAAGYSLVCVRGMKLTLTWTFLREPFRLALPIIPSSILGQLSSNIDRFVLLNYLPRAQLGQLGLYAQAVKVGSVLDILTRAMKTVWFPILLRLSPGDEENEALLTRSYLFSFDFFAFVVLGISFLGIPVIRLVAPEAYHPMCVYLPAIGFILLVKNYAFLPTARLLTTRFAMATLITTVATAGVAVGLHALFTVRFGLVGALVSLGGTYLFSYLLSEGLAKKVYPTRLPWGRLTGRFLCLGAVIAGATALARIDPCPLVTAAQLGGFVLLGLPLGALYYRRRRDFFLRTGPTDTAQPPDPPQSMDLS